MAAISLSAVFHQSFQGNSFADRVEFLVNSRGCSKAWVSQELGISKQALNHILRHGKKPKFVSEIALLFNVSPHWLETGQGKIQEQVNQLLGTISLYTLEDVLREKDINSLTVKEKIFLKIENDHTYFAIQFENYPSMSSRFEEKEILIFDKNIPPKNGAYVLAKQNDGSILLRKLLLEEDKIILKPENSDFSSLEVSKIDVIGVLIETRIRF